MATIKGILKNASGVRPNTKIILKSIKTTSDVIVSAPDFGVVTDANGAYSFECNPSLYAVTISQNGMQRENAGVIRVYHDTADSDINTLILCPVEDLTPELVKQFEVLKLESQKSANDAENSAKKAALEVEKIDTKKIIDDAAIKSIKHIGSRIRLVRDSNGNDNLMVVIPVFTFDDIGMSDIMGGGVHPAFLRKNGSVKAEILVGAFAASIVEGNAIVTPGFMPATNIDFDDARAKCAAMGEHWHMMTNLEWSAVAMWCMANNYQPSGNTEFGRSHEYKYQTCSRNDGKAPNDRSSSGLGLCGTGMDKWRHDGTQFGVCDLVGNTWEFTDGCKLIDNKLNISNHNDQAEVGWTDTGIGFISTGGAWGKVALDGTSNKLKQMLVESIPETSTLKGTVFLNKSGNLVTMRGGDWTSGANSGLGSLNFTSRNGSAYCGFRPVYSL